MRRLLLTLAVLSALALTWTSAEAQRRFRFVTAGGGGSAQLLDEADFTILGYIQWDVDGSESAYAQGLTHRYDGSGHLRFLTMLIEGGNEVIVEKDFDGVSLGATVTGVDTTWATPWGGTGLAYSDKHFSLFYDSVLSKVWTAHAPDYYSGADQAQIYSRTLNSNGTISNLRGPIGLEAIGSKRLDGAILKVPAGDQSLYGFAAYASCGGGYHSLVAGGPNLTSYGLSAWAFPNPEGYSDSTEIPDTDFKRLADFSGGGTGVDDWWTGTALTAPDAFDRGARLTGGVTNYGDGTGGNPGVNAQNPIDSPTMTVTVSAANPAIVTFESSPTTAGSGTARAGSTSTTFLFETGDPYGNGGHIGHVIHITGGTGSGQRRAITNNVDATDTATIDTAWSVTPDATSTYTTYSSSFYAAADQTKWWQGYSITIGGVPSNIPAFQVTINGTAYTIATVDSGTQLTLTTTATSGSGRTLVGPTARPVHAPNDYGRWIAPAPDGKGRMVYTDAYQSACQWVRGSSRYGVMAVLTGAAGSVYYASSTLHMDARLAEMHIFDPAVLAQVAAGTLEPWEAQPTHMFSLDLPDFDGMVSLTGGPPGSISGATFDSTTGILWLFAPGTPTSGTARLYAVQVNGAN